MDIGDIGNFTGRKFVVAHYDLISTPRDATNKHRVIGCHFRGLLCIHSLNLDRDRPNLLMVVTKAIN